MNFKNKIKVALIGIGMMAMSSPSIASTGAENILGKQFCSARSTGWAFTEDGYAYDFAPNIGAPNPFIYHQVNFLRHPDRFSINTYEKGTNKLIQRGATFTYDHETQSIVAGSYLLSVKACR